LTLCHEPSAIFFVVAALTVAAPAPQFSLVQPEVFSASGGMPNASRDFLATETRYPDRLVHNDGGRFTDVLPKL
jgi:hypothetical protein